jgi:hypothetical protein
VDRRLERRSSDSRRVVAFSSRVMGSGSYKDESIECVSRSLKRWLEARGNIVALAQSCDMLGRCRLTSANAFGVVVVRFGSGCTPEFPVPSALT